MSLRHGLSSSLRAFFKPTRLPSRLGTASTTCQSRSLSLSIRPNHQPREFPHFTPSYPSYFFPSRYFSASKPVFTSTSAVHTETAKKTLPSKGVYRWLFLCSGLTLGVIVVGGVTRLTESGLSITEWRPVTGILPPLNAQAWEEEFSKYRETPEFKM